MNDLGQLLPVLTAVLLAAMAGCLVSMLTLAVGRRWREHRDTARLHESRGRIGAALASGDEDDAAHAARSLQRLRLELRFRLVADALATLSGEHRQRLLELADTEKMAAEARRRCRSRRWYRRLRGLRELAVVAQGADLAAELLDDPDPRVRSEAARLAGSAGDQELLHRVADALADPAAGCRFAAADVLARAGAPAVPAVRAALETTDGRTRLLALEVAAALADPRLLEPAQRHRDVADPAVRRGVAAVCAAVGGPEATATLDVMLDDPAAGVRVQAARGVGRLRHWQSAPLLAQRLRDVDFEVRRAAGLALWELGPTGQMFLRRELRGDDAYAADMARQVLDLPQDVRRGG